MVIAKEYCRIYEYMNIRKVRRTIDICFVCQFVYRMAIEAYLFTASIKNLA